MNIIKYRSNRSIDVYFPEYNWIAKNRQYDAFKIGTISCPYEKRHYNIGYIGEGEYKPTINKKPSKIYTIWHDMLGRCYDEKHRHKYKTYSNITVCDEWLNFQNFAKWFDENYYEVEGEEMCLDKDILIKDNKVYSPDTCIFVPERINNLFIKSNNIRGKYPIGVTYNKKINKYQAQCKILKNNKIETYYIGIYDTVYMAFLIYKDFKEKYIKKVADEYKYLIPKELYKAMHDYKVEIND